MEMKRPLGTLEGTILAQWGQRAGEITCIEEKHGPDTSGGSYCAIWSILAT